MELTEGDVTDYNYIKERIKEIAEVVNIQEICYDRWNSSQLILDIISEGIAECTPFGQGFASMSAPTKNLEKIVIGKELNHGNNRVLRFMCSNVAIKTDPAGNIKLDKSKSTEKIDGMIALVMALGSYMNGNTKQDNPYDDRGVLFI